MSPDVKKKLLALKDLESRIKDIERDLMAKHGQHKDMMKDLVVDGLKFSATQEEVSLAEMCLRIGSTK